MEKKNKYQWQGENIKIEWGYCAVKLNEEKPMYWYNYECNLDCPHCPTDALIDAIKITTKDNYSFVIANHFGIGAHKLINGGCPNYTHFSLPVNTFKESHLIPGIRKFDLEGYQKHESGRNTWRKLNFPKDYEEMESLRKIIANGRNLTPSK